MQHRTWGIPAGFLIASLVWVLPRLEGTGEVLTIILLTYMIGLGGLLPALVGNVIGGTGIFAALTYGQVRDEM